MKRILIFAFCLAFAVTLFSCGRGDDFADLDGTRSESNVTDSTSASQKSDSGTDSVPDPEPMETGDKVYRAIYGKRTGTDKTFTGLEPLKEVQLSVVDPDNLRGLDTTPMNHSFGVSKDEKPHEISVNNQAIYEKFDGMCLDTSGERVIYLTFDCGYENGCTAKILDTLKEKSVKASFFVTLDHVKSAPEIVARMINEGHIVGNHSDSHPDFSTISRTQMAKEIENLDNYLRVNFGYSSPFFRFPAGTCSESALDLVQNCGYKSVFWSSSYADWDTQNVKGKQYAYDTVTSRLHPGCVLLLHAVSSDNVEALGDIIDYAHSQGYVFAVLK